MMFANFPVIDYYFDDPENQSRVTHITRRAAFLREIMSNIDVYDEYLISDGEYPETISNAIYGTPFYHWIILLFNDIVDPSSQWPKTTEMLYSYCKRKYGEDNVYSIHHYEDSLGNWIQNGNSLQSVSNFDYENSLNEAKRKIKIPRKQYITRILNEHEKVLKDV